MERLLIAEEVAKRLKVPIGTLAVWRRRGEGPPFIRVGDCTIRYSEDALSKWLDECSVPVDKT